MWDWVRRRPQRCLKFGTDCLGWAECERSWYGRLRQRYGMSPLEVGAMRSSPTVDNVSQPSILASQVCALAGVDGKRSFMRGVFFSELPRRIAVLLPDTAVRTAVLYLDQIPIRREERDALIRWRLGQEQIFPLNSAKIVSQVFGGHGEGSERRYTVLAVAVQESILSQYESLCESVGLIPSEVGITSFRLFYLWKRMSRWGDGLVAGGASGATPACRATIRLEISRKAWMGSEGEPARHGRTSRNSRGFIAWQRTVRGANGPLNSLGRFNQGIVPVGSSRSTYPAGIGRG